MSEQTTPVTSQSGRDLPVAITVGVALMAAVVTSLFIVKEVFALLAIVAVGAAMW